METQEPKGPMMVWSKVIESGTTTLPATATAQTVISISVSQPGHRKKVAISKSPIFNLVSGSGLQGNTDATTVQKNFLRPFEASAIRIHPVRWYGMSMAMRVEIYACLTKFNWQG